MASLERDRGPSARPVSTGYADLDKLLYGGLPPNCAVALTSLACNERDLLVKDFLETGARKGEVTFYVTIDPGATKLLAEEFPSNFHLFVCNPQADAIVEDLPNVLKLKGVENLTEVSMALTSEIRKLDSSMKGSRRICLGLVSDVLLQHHAVQTRRWLTSLLSELKSTGFTTLAVIDPQMHPSEELHAILGLLDGDISIYEKETDEGLRKYLRIKKMGNSKYPEDELLLGRLETISEVKPHESKTEQAVFDKHRIAVLPFVNMSPDPNDEYFTDGMTEEIISTVSGISDLEVISRTSVMGYKGTAKRVKEIGRELEVGSVLEGSFRKAGTRIRVTTQLIDVATDRHLWAQNYDRNLEDVFAVQSDVAKQVAEALQVRILSPEKERIEKKPTESTTAYSLYLRGRYYWNKRGLEDVKRALEYFELAVHEDPCFALGYVGISDCCLILRGTYRVEREANLERERVMANKALELDPELAEAHASRGALLFWHEYDSRQAEEELRRAIELKPSYATAHQWYASLLTCQTRWDEAREQIEKAVELDPLSPIIHFNHGGYYFDRKDYSKAIEPFRKAIELGLADAHAGLAQVFGLMKKFEDTRREYETWVELSKDSVPLAKLQGDVGIAYGMSDKATLSRLLTELEAHFQDDRGPTAYQIGTLHLYLGENDKGFEWLERSYSRKEYYLMEIKVDPDLDGVRTDPRYLDLLKRLGLDQTVQPTS